MSALLEAKEVTKIYAKAQRPSLNKVSFSVSKSEFIAIMGASGSGKTTLLNVLSTIDTPTGGSITIDGVNIKNLTDSGAADFRRDKLGFIFQEYLLLDSLTIFENIAVPLTLQKLPPKKIENMIKSLAETFGIDSQLNKYPNELSGGQRQRLSIARALVKKPEILILDDTSSALDYATDAKLRRAISALGGTVFIVSQRVSSVMHADKIVVLNDGAVAGIGTHEELLSSCEVYREIHDTQFREKA